MAINVSKIVNMSKNFCYIHIFKKTNVTGNYTLNIHILIDSLISHGSIFWCSDRLDGNKPLKPECNISKIYYSIGKKKGISIYCMSGLCWMSTILDSMLFDSYLIHCIWWWIYIYLIQMFIVILFTYGFLCSFFCLSFSSSVSHHCFILLTHIEKPLLHSINYHKCHWEATTFESFHHRNLGSGTN